MVGKLPTKCIKDRDAYAEIEDPHPAYEEATRLIKKLENWKVKKLEKRST